MNQPIEADAQPYDPPTAQDWSAAPSGNGYFQTEPVYAQQALPAPMPMASTPPPENSWGPGLCAIIVKSDGGEFAVSCVRSLRRDWAASGYPTHLLQVIVVQNACSVDQSQWLQILTEEGALVLETGCSMNHAAAVEFGLQYSSGDEDDVVAVLSPFLVFLPGSVGRMMEYMASHPDCGLLGPRCYFDEAKQFQHPSLPLPTARSEVGQLLSALSQFVGRRRSRSLSEDNAEWWSEREPLETDMLSSGCLFVSRSLVIEHGFLFDASFPLGYEDADLCRRVRACGRWVVYLPKAEVILHGLPVDTMADPVDLRQRYEISRRAYFLRYLSWGTQKIVQWLEDRVDALQDDPRQLSIHPLAELGGHARPFELELPPPGDWILELSPTPHWTHALGCFATPGHWRFPEKAWQRLPRGLHYLRVIDLATQEVVCAYRFEKLVEGQQLAVPVAPPGQYVPSVHQHWPDRMAG